MRGMIGFVLGCLVAWSGWVQSAQPVPTPTPPSLDLQPGKQALAQCLQEAKATSQTDKREVCFTRKEVTCLRIQQANARMLKQTCLRTLSTQQKTHEAICTRNLALLESDLTTCQAQARILSTKKCECNCTLPWAFGTVIGVIGGGLAGGLICHATR